MAGFGTRGVGRPGRQALDIARACAWYECVRQASGWSEPKLEAEFDEGAAAVAERRHRSARWNKYKSGRSSPPRSLIDRVDKRFANTAASYDHPVWDLAQATSVTSGDLGRCVRRLCPSAVNLFVAAHTPTQSPFWLRSDYFHEDVFVQVATLLGRAEISPYDAMAALLVVAHQSILRQNEFEHFEAYVAMALHAQRRLGGAATVSPWLVAHVFESWLLTNYAREDYREVVVQLRVGPAFARDDAHAKQASFIFAERMPGDARWRSARHAVWAAGKLLELQSSM